MKALTKFAKISSLALDIATAAALTSNIRAVGN
jgi:hypothetical protein